MDEEGRALEGSTVTSGYHLLLTSNMLPVVLLSDSLHTVPWPISDEVLVLPS